ncbi:MAG: CHAT domain-containing protein [Candidatus Xenobiia bacterium LiM19]
MSRANRIFFICLVILVSSYGEAFPVDDTMRRLIAEGEKFYQEARYREAAERWAEGLVLARRSGDSQAQSAFLGNKGRILYCQGDYEKAISAFSEALLTARTVADRNGEGAILANLGAVCYTLGDYGNAEEYWEKALALLIECGRFNAAAGVKGNLGLLFHSVGEDDKAKSTLKEALRLSRKERDEKEEVSILISLASLECDTGEKGKSLNTLERALAISRKLQLRRDEGIVLTGTSIVMAENGDFDGSIAAAEKATAIFKDISDPDGLFRVYAIKASACEKLGAPEKAIVLYKKSIDIIEGIRENLNIESHKILFIEDKMDVYESLIRLLVSQGSTADAWRYVERSKARAFLDMLGNRIISVKDSAYQEKLAELNAVEETARTLRKILENEHDDSKSQKLHRQIEECEVQYYSLLKEMRENNARFSMLTAVDTAEPEEIQHMMGSDELMLEYFTGKKTACLFLLSRDSLLVRTLALSGERLDDKVIRLRTVLSSRISFKDETVSLSGILLPQENSAIMEEKRHIIVVPHGTLHCVPFALLMGPEGSPLIDRYDLQIEPSASVWRLCRAMGKSRQEGIAAFALGDRSVAFDGDSGSLLRGSVTLTKEQRGDKGLPPLPATGKEVRNIGRYFSKKTILIGEEMTEQKVREAAPHHRIVHYATHSILEPRYPLFSGIVLSDSVFTVNGILSLNLDADLVVLSACGTSGGELSRGDDLVGISRAFIYAGTPSVTATLWNVQDRSTALLMSDFYRRLSQGIEGAKALSAAQRNLRKKYSHPFYWAPFIYIGDSRTIDFNYAKGGPAAGVFTFLIAIIVCVAVFFIGRLIVRRYFGAGK